MGKISKKSIHSRFLNFINFLLFLISITIIFAVIVLLNIHPFIDFLPFSDGKELKGICDDLIKESEKWVFLLPPKIQEEKNESQPTAEPKFIEIATKEQFENTKKWLEDKRTKFEENIKEIETYLPFSIYKIEESKKEIVKSFHKFSEISKVISLKEFDMEIDKDIKFIQIGYRPIIQKDCFLTASFVDCSALWFVYGRNVAFGEINYFIEQILGTPDIEKIELDDVEEIMNVYDKIESTINLLKGKGYNPSTIFIPLDYLSKFRKDGLNKESKLYGKFPYSDRQFKFDDSTKLDIIHSSNHIKFKDIILLDKKAFVWRFKPSGEDKERLHIEIKEYEKDLSKVDLIAKTVINLKIENSDAIKILYPASEKMVPP